MLLLSAAWSIVRYHHDVFGNIILIIRSENLVLTEQVELNAGNATAAG